MRRLQRADRSRPTGGDRRLPGALAFGPPAQAQTPGAERTPIPGNPVSAAHAPATSARPRRRARSDAPSIPRHPFMAPNGSSNLHNDAFQSDTYTVSGPLGRDPRSSLGAVRPRVRLGRLRPRGRIVTVCVGLDRPVLALLDPVTLKTIDAMPLAAAAGVGQQPVHRLLRRRLLLPRQPRPRRAADDRGPPAHDRRRGNALQTVSDVDLTPATKSGKVISALPDWKGRVWFATKRRRRLGRSRQRRAALASARRGDLELVCGRSGRRRLHRHRRGALSARGRGGRTRGRLAARLQEHERAEARADESRLGDDADAAGRALCGDRRQCRSDGLVVFDRARKPQRRRVVCRIAVLREGGRLDRSVADRDRPLARGREQLRLHGHQRASSCGATTTLGGIERIDIKPPRKLRPGPEPQLPAALEQRRDRALGGAEALGRPTACSTPTRSPPASQRRTTPGI